MIKVVFTIPESDINSTLSKLIKLGIINIKVKKKGESFCIFRYKNMFENSYNKSDK